MVVEIAVKGEKLAVKAPYHPDLVAELKERLNGRWDRSTGEWLVDARDKERVLRLLRGIFGYAPGDPLPELVTVVLTEPYLSKVAGYQDLFLFGRCIASRRGRDYPVRLGEGVIIRSGGFPDWGGSAKYPALAPYAGTSLEVRDVPRVLAERLRAKYPDGVEILDGQARQPAQDEVERLVAQVKLLNPEQRRSFLERLMAETE